MSAQPEGLRRGVGDGRDVPDADAAIPAARGQEITLGCKGETRNGARVILEIGDGFERGSVPQSDRLAPCSRGKIAAVRAVNQASLTADARVVEAERLGVGMFEVPKPAFFGRGGGRDCSTARAKSKADDFATGRVQREPPDARCHVPDEDDAVLAAGRQRAPVGTYRER